MQLGKGKPRKCYRSCFSQSVKTGWTLSENLVWTMPNMKHKGVKKPCDTDDGGLRGEWEGRAPNQPDKAWENKERGLAWLCCGQGMRPGWGSPRSVRARVVWTSSWQWRRPCLGFFVDLPFWSSRRGRSGWGLKAVSCHFWPNAFRVTVPRETNWGGQEFGERWEQCLWWWGWDGSCWVSLCSPLVWRCPLLYPLGLAVGLGPLVNLADLCWEAFAKWLLMPFCLFPSSAHIQ